MNAMRSQFMAFVVALSLALCSCDGSGSSGLESLVGRKVLVTTSEPVALSSNDTAIRFGGKLVASDAMGILVEVDGDSAWIKIDSVVSVVAAED